MAVQRYQQHLATLSRAPDKVVIQLAFQRAVTTGGLFAVLRAVFDELAIAYTLPDEGVAAGGARYWLTATGHGLRLAREQTGAVRGDAYTDYLDLLLPGEVLVSTDITEDSYQPDLVFTVTGPDADMLDQLTLILERWLRTSAGLTPAT